MITSDLILDAIKSKLIIECDYHKYHRVLEPHVYGIHNEKYQLLSYQIRGNSSNGKLGWKRLFVNEIINPYVMKEYFDGRRSTMTHPKWDQIFSLVRN